MEIKLNLASKPYLNRQSVRLWLSLLGILLLLVCLLIGYQGLSSYRQLQQFDQRYQELDDQLAGLPGAPTDYSPAKFAQIRAEVRLANEIIDADRFRWTGLLSRFEKVLPDDVIIHSIQPNFRERTVQLSGVARDLSALTRFVDNLLQSEDLNQAFLKSHSDVEKETPNGRQALTGFSITIREAF